MFRSSYQRSPGVVIRIICMTVMGLFFFEGHSQVFISSNPLYLKKKTESDNLTGAFHRTYPDSSVSNLHNFFPRNFLGNIALPSPSYFLKYGTGEMGYRFFDPPISNDRIDDQQVEYYRTKGPFADLTAIGGSKLLQAFKMLFTHTYKEKVNITLRFNRYSSQGFYLKQQSYANNFFLSSNYTSKNKRFGYYLYALNNGNKNQENGGIVAGVLTDSTATTNKALLPVKLNGANRDNRETRFMLNPWLRLNKWHDSAASAGHFIQLKSKAGVNSYKYKDSKIQSDDFYKLIYLDTLATLDSSNVKRLSNELDYTFVAPNNELAFSLGFKNELVEVWQYSNELFHNNIFVSDLVWQPALKNDSAGVAGRSLESRTRFEYVVEGVNSGNYKAENRSVFHFDENRKHHLYFAVLAEKRNADRIYNTWQSNHFSWINNGYRPQEQLQLNAGVTLGKMFGASLLFQNIYNYLYFDELALPRQYNKNISNTAVSLSFGHVLFRHLGVALSCTYQATSNEALVRLPKNSASAKLYYTGNLFKNNLQLQLGSQIEMYQDFYAYDYMPATQAFYLQNSFKTEAYPFVDVFLNARIRPVSFFLKMENVLAGLAGNNYAFVRGYYQPPRAFRFGLTWIFFD